MKALHALLARWEGNPTRKSRVYTTADCTFSVWGQSDGLFPNCVHAYEVPADNYFFFVLMSLLVSATYHETHSTTLQCHKQHNFNLCHDHMLLWDQEPVISRWVHLKRTSNSKTPHAMKYTHGLPLLCSVLSWIKRLRWFVCYSRVYGAMASQITGVSIVCSTVCSGVDQRKHQSSASLALVRGIHRWPVDSPHKGPETRKVVPFDDVIMNS